MSDYQTYIILPEAGQVHLAAISKADKFSCNNLPFQCTDMLYALGDSNFEDANSCSYYSQSYEMDIFRAEIIYTFLILILAYKIS